MIHMYIVIVLTVLPLWWGLAMLYRAIRPETGYWSEENIQRRKENERLQRNPHHIATYGQRAP